MGVPAQDRIKSWLLNRFRVKSIRSQLTLGLAATLIPVVAIGHLATREFVRTKIYLIWEKRLQAEAELISYGLREWVIGLSNSIEALTISSTFKGKNIAEVQLIFKALATDNPYRIWSYWSGSMSSPKLLATTAPLTNQVRQTAESNQGTRSYYQAALRGYSTYQVVNSKVNGFSCLNIAQPVFSESTTGHQRIMDVGSLLNGPDYLSIPIRPDIIGVLVLCLPISRLGEETGLTELFKDKRLELVNNNENDFLNDPKGFASALILVSNTGELLFPGVKSDALSKITLIADLENTKLPTLGDVAEQARNGKRIFTRIKDGGQSYLALTTRVDSAWSLILLLNERSASSDVDAISRVQVLFALLSLFLLMVVIAYRSKLLSRPISMAGDALQQISKGNFDVRLQTEADDEIGGLLRNVQSTADRLKCYLNEVTSFVVTQKQIDTAKAIQQDFLLASLPSSPSYDVEAISRPALEVGADWYDMVDVGDHVIVVVADVCDKGVPSALYMSVFRSLIRSKLLDHIGELDSSQDASSVIRDAIEETNNYMASNQNNSMMFATLFIAAIHKITGHACYVCAGHESPVLVSSVGTTMLDKVSGPAIGLFEDASYPVSYFDVQPGDSLVIYTDGLIDARDLQNVGWGLYRLRELLDVTRVKSASQLMALITSQVDDHMAGADPFDDLTIMVFRWVGT